MDVPDRREIRKRPDKPRPRNATAAARPTAAGHSLARPGAPLGARIVTPEELACRQFASAELLELARPHLEWLSAAQAAIRHVAYLVDCDGIVLYSTGDAGAVRTLGRPGSDWSEAARGANGPGTALARGEPVVFEGEEPFARGQRGHTCMGAPIRGACGGTIGAIGLGMPAAAHSSERLLVVAHAAYAIGQELRYRESLQRTQASLDAERRLAEELQESRARFDGAFDRAAIGMAITNPDGRWVKVNRGLCDILGYTEEELLAGGFRAITHPDDAAASLYLLQQLLSGAIDRCEIEKRYIHKLGHVVWTSLNVVVVRDARGALGYVVSQMQDITARKRAEAALRESEARYRSLSAAAPVGIFQSDSEGNITYANPTALRIFGLTEAEGLGRGFVARIHPDDADAVVTGWSSALREGREYEHEYRLVLPDESIRWVRCKAAPLQGVADATAAGTVGTVEDATARKELEAQLLHAQKMEAVGQLAGGIAHDFNNLLTIISAHAELALLTLPAELPMAEDIQEIKRASTRAASLTRQLLAFSRKQVLQPQVLDLDTVIAGLVPMLQRLLGEDIEIATTVSRGLGAVRADPGQLEQVLVNLAVNARDAMPMGGALVLRTENVELDGPGGPRRDGVPAGRYVCLTVSDTGSGIPREIRERIFEPFFTTKAVGKGTGLGLSTVYGIVKQSGGFIWVESEAGRGTTFTVYLPRAVDAEKPASVPAPGEVGANGAETVLVVEDEEGVRHLTRRILERQGYTVIEACDGRDALQRAAAHGGRIDLLLTDMVMPEMTGRALAEVLVAERPGLRVLYMSGYTDDEIVRRGMRDAGSGFVEKPFTTTSLVRVVRAALDRSAA